jgi:hypothetical protein
MLKSLVKTLTVSVGAAGFLFGAYQWWHRHATRIRIEPRFLGLLTAARSQPVVQLSAINESEHPVTITDLGVLWQGAYEEYALHLGNPREMALPAVVAPKHALERSIPAIKLPRTIEGKSVRFRLFIRTTTFQRFLSRWLVLPDWMEAGLSAMSGNG